MVTRTGSTTSYNRYGNHGYSYNLEEGGTSPDCSISIIV
jgi:hypothetical protein